MTTRRDTSLPSRQFNRCRRGRAWRVSARCTGQKRCYFLFLPNRSSQLNMSLVDLTFQCMKRCDQLGSNGSTPPTRGTAAWGWEPKAFRRPTFHCSAVERGWNCWHWRVVSPSFNAGLPIQAANRRGYIYDRYVDGTTRYIRQRCVIRAGVWEIRGRAV